MRRSEILEMIITIVEAETETPREVILSDSKKSDVVDARSIIIQLLYAKGFYVSQIASILSRSGRSVSNALTGFDDRLAQNKIMKVTYEHIRNIIESRLEVDRKQ